MSSMPIGQNYLYDPKRGNSVALSNPKKVPFSSHSMARRRTTITGAFVTPFELRAIRLNTYLNVIINSQAVSDLVLLIERALQT